MSVQLLLRLTALLGAFFLLLASIASAFVKETFRLMHRPFLRVHHTLAASGLVLITLHPILFAWQSQSLAIFVPVLSPWNDFLVWGGRVALPLIYVAVIAAMLGKRVPRYWRPWHWLIYPAVLLGGIHAQRLGRDLRNPVLAIGLGIMLGLTLATFIYKRLRPTLPHRG